MSDDSINESMYFKSWSFMVFPDIAGWVKFVESEASIAYMNYGAATQSIVTISLGQGQISGALD